MRLQCVYQKTHLDADEKNAVTYRSNKLDIFTVPTKAKSREPAYSQTLNQNNIDRQRVKIQTVLN